MKKMLLGRLLLTLLILIFSASANSAADSCKGYYGVNPTREFFIKSPSGMSIYFIMMRLFGENNFDSVVQSLPNFKKMGINTVWISPPQPQTNARPPIFTLNDHGYWASNHAEIDSSYGGEAGFKKMVSEAKKMGIEVCLDAVLNHFGYSDFVEINGKQVSTKDPRYFVIPEAHEGHYHPREQYLWDGMEKSLDITELRALKKEFEKFTIYGLPTLNWHNPEVFDYMVNSYKKFVDRGIYTFRIDAAKHLPTDMLVKFSNEISAYAATKGNKAKFIWEFFVSNSGPLALYAKDAISLLNDKSSTFFFDFPMMREFRRLQEVDYSFEWLAGFVKYRLEHKHPLSQMIPVIEDHDSGTPISDRFRSYLIYSSSEFFSMNPTIMYQGTEQAGKRTQTRESVAGANEKGDLSHLRSLMASALSKYRMDESSEVKFHKSEKDLIVAERMIPNSSTLFYAANKGRDTIEVAINPDHIKSMTSAIRNILNISQATAEWSNDKKQLILRLPPNSILTFELN